MKRVLLIVLAVAVTALFSTGLYAQDKKGTTEMGMMQGNMTQEGTMWQGKMHEWKKGGMHGWGEKCVTRGPFAKEMVATSDGGVVILIGKKLMKYDKDLNLVKEVELKIDKGEWKKMKEEKAQAEESRE